MKKLAISCVAAFLLSGTTYADSYAPARRYEHCLSVSGQYPIDLDTGMLVGGNIQDLTNKVVDNLSFYLKQNGFDLRDVFSLTVYLADIRDYAAVDQVLGQRFAFKMRPTRDVIEASNLLYDARIEISCQATK